MKIHGNLGFLINRAGLKMKLKMLRTFSENGYLITMEHWGVLQCLYEKDGQAQVELAVILDKDKPNITRILDVMAKKDLIVRKADPNDRRKYLIFLTEKAYSIKKDLFRLAKQVRKEIVSGISEPEIEKLITIINKIYKNVS